MPIYIYAHMCVYVRVYWHRQRRAATVFCQFVCESLQHRTKDAVLRKLPITGQKIE